ncbi:hypothetical protein GCM10009676_26880 [Prauserella halophila]|uniref:Uncharacterized protein n=1 Tax=Prauserella halophila TaxID=185641 RepID=A0ABN1W8M2_9PSEU|nr:hypothetical protein [Prauserella halophila]MCP2235062.1 hypothetical protein [Prauserella halophila]
MRRGVRCGLAAVGAVLALAGCAREVPGSAVRGEPTEIAAVQSFIGFRGSGGKTAVMASTLSARPDTMDSLADDFRSFISSIRLQRG